MLILLKITKYQDRGFILSKTVKTTFCVISSKFNPTYNRPFGVTPGIGYACSICAILMKLWEIKQLVNYLSFVT